MRIVFFILSLFLLITFSSADPNECINQYCEEQYNNCLADVACDNAYNSAEDCGFSIPCINFAFKILVNKNQPATALLNCAIQCIA